jgi:hypothetical protein
MKIELLQQRPSKPSAFRFGDHLFDDPVILIEVSTWKPNIATGYNLGGGEYFNHRVIVILDRAPVHLQNLVIAVGTFDLHFGRQPECHLSKF